MKNITRIAMAQINCTVGDLNGNSAKIVEWLKKAEAAGADIAVFPELAITGYPPEDLLLKPKFIADNIEALNKVVRAVGDTIAVVGFVDQAGEDIYNAAAVIYKGEIKGIYHKVFLPNYGVFDEKRYFKAGAKPRIFSVGNINFGVNICEDIWHKDGPVREQAATGAKLILNINSSPYHMGKIKEREELIKREARDNAVFIAYANMVGGQDELVFDGRSMMVDPTGRIISRAEAFKEDLPIADIDVPAGKAGSIDAIAITDALKGKERTPISKKEAVALDPAAEVYQALSLGLTDYVKKNGFKKVVIGLSGGIDSAMVAAVASDSLGKENVTGVFMPTRYSSSESEKDASRLADNLGIKFMTISIEHIYKLYLTAFETLFAGAKGDVTEENIQARIRGNILMALSNKFGWLVLTTGNKSEMSTGYATLYGDMAGGLAVIKDVPKTLVYKLALYRNSLGKVIQDSILTKEPTAELRPGQKDSDTLPPYEILDPIIKAYVEEDSSPADIIDMGFEKNMVAKVISLIDKSEYKRRQSPPGIKITPKAFGRDRRMPVTNKYA
jgi:NAD+ synthase (glutamine-hydrolysing)